MKFKIITKFVTKSILFQFINKIISWPNGFYLHTKFNLILNKFPAKSNRFTGSLIDNALYGLIKGYYLYIELRGVGYRFKLLSSGMLFGIILRIGYSHLVYLKMPKTFRLYYYNRLTLCLYSSDLWQLGNRIHLIKIQKKTNPYKGKGVFSKSSILKLKKSTKLRF